MGLNWPHRQAQSLLARVLLLSQVPVVTVVIVNIDRMAASSLALLPKEWLADANVNWAGNVKVRLSTVVIHLVQSVRVLTCLFIPACKGVEIAAVIYPRHVSVHINPVDALSQNLPCPIQLATANEKALGNVLELQ